MKKMLDKNLNEIEITDLQELIDGQVRESRTLEFKRELPGNDDKSKRELTADVTALANTSGGDLIFGIAEHDDSNPEQKGIAKEIISIKDSDIDQVIQRLHSILRTNAEPKIPSVQIAAIPTDGGHVVIVRVRKSWIAPHAVHYGDGKYKFWLRIDNAKAAYDVHEIRSAFIESNELTKRIQDFRNQRISKILTDETPAKLIASPKLLLHIIPMCSVDSDMNLSIRNIRDNSSRTIPWRSRDSGRNTRINFDGLFAFENCAYSQYFRNGIVEGVYCLGRDQENEYCIASMPFREVLHCFFTHNLSYLNDLQVDGPKFLMVSIHGASQCVLKAEETNEPHLAFKSSTDRDDLIFDPVLIQEEDLYSVITLKSLLDQIWNAFGYLESP